MAGQAAADGTPFGRYRLVELLGRGGMGEVWRAYDTDTDRIVAIKVLPAHFSDNEDFKQRFRREAHAAARLNTPHVVPIHHYGEIDGRLYVDMRLIEGRDLQTVLADGPLSPGRAVRIIEGVALALHAAHKVGLLHRDVKPSNILLDENDFAYLIDFGIARAADETRMTKPGYAIGTFQYIAPERLGTRAEEDARADTYSLACVLYECLTGRPPFAADTMAGLVAAHLNTPPPQPSATQPNVPAQIDEVIATGMAKDPDQRYATAAELANAARDAITTPLAPPSEPTLLADATRPAPAPEPVGQQSAEPTLPAPHQRPPGRRPVPQPRRADRSPPQPATLFLPATPTPRPWWRRKAIVIPAALLTVAVIAAAIFITSQQHENSNGPQITLPFTGLNQPSGVAVDKTGTVYVADSKNDRVLKLAAGSTTPTELPFHGLGWPVGVAVDTAGAVYVTGIRNVYPTYNAVLKLPAGSDTPSELPIRGGGGGVAVDTIGAVYVTTSMGSVPGQVLKLAAGASAPTELPFPKGDTIDYRYVAVDSAGSVYVTSGANERSVLKLAAGASAPTPVPFSGLHDADGVAVDSAGSIYVADGWGNGVLKLAAGAATPTTLPFIGLSFPDSVAEGVAVDSAGNVYVVDGKRNRVLKLAARLNGIAK